MRQSGDACGKQRKCGGQKDNGKFLSGKAVKREDGTFYQWINDQAHQKHAYGCMDIEQWTKIGSLIDAHSPYG